MNQNEKYSLQATKLFMKSMTTEQTAQFINNQQIALDILSEQLKIYTDSCKEAWLEVDHLRHQLGHNEKS